MRGRISSVGVALLAITFATSDVAAQSGEVTGGVIECNAPGFDVIFTGTWSGT